MNTHLTECTVPLRELALFFGCPSFVVCAQLPTQEVLFFLQAWAALSSWSDTVEEQAQDPGSEKKDLAHLAETNRRALADGKAFQQVGKERRVTRRNEALVAFLCECCTSALIPLVRSTQNTASEDLQPLAVRRNHRRHSCPRLGRSQLGTGRPAVLRVVSRGRAF